MNISPLLPGSECGGGVAYNREHYYNNSENYYL